MTRPIFARNNFQEGFGHYTDQNTPGENKWRALEDSIQMDWKLKGSNELIVPGQNIAFSSEKACRQLKNEAYISGLGLPKAF